jgi:hypothetical protein
MGMRLRVGGSGLSGDSKLAKVESKNFRRRQTNARANAGGKSFCASKQGSKVRHKATLLLYSEIEFLNLG